MRLLLETLYGCDSVDPSHKEVRSLRRHMEKHGMRNPLIVTPEGRVLIGCQRLAILRELNHRTAPCVVVKSMEEAARIKNEDYEKVEMWK